jgi:serine/threonine protein kinase
MIQYKIIKELGHGTKGKVYLVEVENKFYALKIEKLNKVYFWREINFYKNFALIYPSNFIQLIDYEIKDNIVKKICTFVDTTLDKIIYTLNKFQLLSIIIQITYCVYLLHTNNYVHGDLRAPNIGVNKTTQTHINILSYKIPTYGWVVQLIDFGSIGEKNEAIKLNDLEWYENKFRTGEQYWDDIKDSKGFCLPVDSSANDGSAIEYIRLDFFLVILNAYFNLKNEEGNLISKIVIPRNLPILASEDSVSVDSKTCLIKNPNATFITDTDISLNTNPDDQGFQPYALESFVFENNRREYSTNKKVKDNNYKRSK